MLAPPMRAFRRLTGSGGGGGASVFSVVTQQIHVSNSMHGVKSLVMRLKISYKLGGAPVEEAATVSAFPPGC